MGVKYDTPDGLRLYLTGKGAIAKNEAGEIKRFYQFGAAFYGMRPDPFPNVERIIAYRALPEEERRRRAGPSYNNAKPVQEWDTPELCLYLAPHTNGDCPDDCERCSHQYRSMQLQRKDVFAYAREVTDAEARISIAELVKSIKDDHDFLRAKVPEYGGALFTRWKKKPKSQQRLMLRKALPGMYEKKWAVPNLDYVEGIGVDWVSAEKDRYSWLLPYLNLETLLEDPAGLMALVHFRTVYSPVDWLQYDNDQADKPFMRGAVAIEFNSHAVSIEEKTFGGLVKYDKDAAHRLTALGYPRARLVLDAQRTLYAFLRKMVTFILEGAEGKGKTEKWTELVRSGFSEGQAMHFGELYLRDPYTAPPRFNTDLMLEIAQGRLHAAEDELWLLQTDPAYLQYVLDDRMATELSRRGQDSMHNWHWIADEVITQAPRRVRIWETVVEEIAALTKAVTTSSKSPAQSTDHAFEQFFGVLRWAERLSNKVLHQMMCETRLFQDHFTYDKKEDGDIECIPIMPDNVHEYFVQTPLMWAASVHSASLEPGQINPYDSRLVNGFIDDFIRNSPAELKRKVDNRFYSHITEMAAIHEIKYIASYYRPKPVETGSDQEELMAIYSDRFFWRHAAAIEELHKSRGVNTQYGVLLKAFYEIRWPKGVKDDKWLQQATECRSALNQLWRAVREDHSTIHKYAQLTDLEKQREMTRISASASREHVTELLKERSAIAESEEKKLKQKQDTAASAYDFGQIASTLQAEPPLRNVKPKKRSQERRPGSNKSEIPIEVTSAVHDRSRVEQRITVSRHSLEIFWQMYPSSLEDATKSTRKWQEVVAALVDAGLAVAPGDGSAVTFKRSWEAGGGSIVLHRPHPSPTVGPVMLQVFGKRLRKWFGWDREMFVEQGQPGN